MVPNDLLSQKRSAIVVSGCEANERRGTVRRLLLLTPRSRRALSTNDYDKVNGMQMQEICNGSGLHLQGW